MVKLGIAIRMRRSFLRSPIRLQAVFNAVEDLGHHPMTGRVPHAVQLRGQLPHTLASPAQRRLRITARDRTCGFILGSPHRRRESEHSPSFPRGFGLSENAGGPHLLHDVFDFGCQAAIGILFQVIAHLRVRSVVGLFVQIDIS